MSPADAPPLSVVMAVRDAAPGSSIALHHIQSHYVDLQEHLADDPCDIRIRRGEIGYGFAAHALHARSGHWDRDLGWHAGHVGPERAQAEDLIGEIRGRRET